MCAVVAKFRSLCPCDLEDRVSLHLHLMVFLLAPLRWFWHSYVKFFMHWFWLPNEMKACEASSLTLPLSTHYYSQHVWGADQEVFERQKRGGACFNFEGQKGDWRDIYTRETTDIWASGLPLWGKERKGADRYLSLEEKDMENNKNRDETNFDFLTFHRLFWTRTLR